MKRFGELKPGQVFVFASETNSKLKGSGRVWMARGPWVKVSARCYVPQEGTGRGEPDVIRIGSINVEVIPDDQEGQP